MKLCTSHRKAIRPDSHLGSSNIIRTLRNRVGVGSVSEAYILVQIKTLSPNWIWKLQEFRRFREFSFSSTSASVAHYSLTSFLFPLDCKVLAILILILLMWLTSLVATKLKAEA